MQSMYAKAKLECPTCGTRWKELTKREQTIYEKMLAGVSIDEIAEELFLSPKTVATYKYRIREKLMDFEERNGQIVFPRGPIQIHLLRNHAVLLRSRWAEHENARKLRERGQFGAGWLEGYRMAIEHMLNPRAQDVHIVDEQGESVCD